MNFPMVDHSHAHIAICAGKTSVKSDVIPPDTMLDTGMDNLTYNVEVHLASLVAALVTAAIVMRTPAFLMDAKTALGMIDRLIPLRLDGIEAILRYDRDKTRLSNHSELVEEVEKGVNILADLYSRDISRIRRVIESMIESAQQNGAHSFLVQMYKETISDAEKELRGQTEDDSEPEPPDSAPIEVSKLPGEFGDLFNLLGIDGGEDA